MSSRLEILVDLLHTAEDAALATHSAALPGYPFASAVPFATDPHHRPILLLSRLAEHTQNLAADTKASLMVARRRAEGEIARVSLVGEVVPIDADSRLVDRYLRFHREAERFLQLGDFGFHRFEPKRIRVVGGFAQAGWLDGNQFIKAPHLELDEEIALLEEARAKLPADVQLLGLDPYGADLAIEGSRTRKTFRIGPVVGEAVLPALFREIET